MKRSTLWGGVIFIGIIVFIYGLANSNNNGVVSESFAKCITNSGAKLYGANWCGHCQEQKESFGDNWQYIDYTECSTNFGQLEICEKEGIVGYPTWIFSNGQRVSGFISLERLARITGCSLT